MGTQSINFNNITDVKYNGNAMDKVYHNSTLLWERAVELTATQTENHFSSGASIRQAGGSRTGYSSQWFGNKSYGYEWIYMYWTELPKPDGFSLPSNQSCAVKIDWDRSASISDYPSYIKSSNRVSYSTSHIFWDSNLSTSGTRYGWIGTGTYSAVAPESQWYVGPKRQWYNNWSWVGVQTQFSSPNVTANWTKSSGKQSTGASSNSVIFGFYHYDIDKPCIGVLGRGLGTDGWSGSGWVGHMFRGAHYNYGKIKRVFEKSKVELIVGGHDPMWPHTKFGITQRNPKRGAL